MSSEALVHVIDDDEAVRDSVAFLFETADLPARTYESAVAFLSTIDQVRAGCVVTDVRMPEMSGIDLLRELKARGFAPPVIVITGHGDVPLALEAVRAGAFDYLEKPFDDDLLLDSVRRAIAQPSGQPDSDEQVRARANLRRLSDDEREVLKGLVAGELNKDIADRLGTNTRSVEVYRAKLMAKMEVGSFADLVRMAMAAEN